MRHIVSRLVRFAGIVACMGTAVSGQGKTLSIENARVEAKFSAATNVTENSTELLIPA